MKRMVLIFLILGCVVLSGCMKTFILSSEEQKFIGTWEHVSNQGNGYQKEIYKFYVDIGTKKVDQNVIIESDVGYVEYPTPPTEWRIENGSLYINMLYTEVWNKCSYIFLSYNQLELTSYGFKTVYTKVK